MAVFSHASILNLVAQGQGMTLLERAVLLLCTVSPELCDEEAWGWSIGDRDRAIWHAWRLQFKMPLESVAVCPQCSEVIEFELPEGFKPLAAISKLACISYDGCDFMLRLPTSRDMKNPSLVGLNLFTNAPPHGEVSQDELETALVSADPGLDTVITHLCPACENQWQQSFDVCRYIWQACDQKYQKLLCDIDVIARNYGWTESEILSLPEARLQQYVGILAELSVDQSTQGVTSRRGLP